MKTYCVSCGEESASMRCPVCRSIFEEGGGIRKETTVRGTIVRVAQIEFHCDAPSIFCHTCGGAIDESRLRYALLKGGECHTCGLCPWNRRVYGKNT